MTFRLHLKNFQSIREATLDIAPLTFLAGPNSAGKSAVADALAALGLHFGQVVAGMNLNRLKSYHRNNSEVMTYGIGGDFSLEADCFYYRYLPFSVFPGPSFLDEGYDLVKGRWYFDIESGDILFSEVPASNGIRFQILIFINGEKAILCDDVTRKVTFFLSHPVISEAIGSIGLPDLIAEELGKNLWELTEESLSVDAEIEVVRSDGTFGVKIMAPFYEGVLSYEVVEYVINAFLAVIGSACGAFQFALSNEQRLDNRVDPLVHIGPLRAIPDQEEWRVETYGVTDKSEWHKGGFAWSRIAGAIAEQERKKLCEGMGVPVRGLDEEYLEGSFPINDHLVRDLCRLNSVLNGEPLRLGYELAGNSKVVVALAGCELPLSASTIAGSDFLVSLCVKNEEGREHLLSDVGVGISQVIPVLYAGLTQPFSIVEQPELHLHPKLQLELASFFIEQAGEGRKFILETHSENMFLRVLRAIRETSASDIKHRRFNLHPEQVSVLYFEKTDDSFTEVHRLRISDDGEFIDRWPDGFFAEREAELF